MKKKIVLAAMAALVMGSVAFASGVRDTVTVEGILEMKESIPVIKSGAKYSILPAGPFYRLAWENGIKVGDKVKVEGVSRDTQENCPIEGAVMLMPSKVWVNGKALDLSSITDRSRFGQGGAHKGARSSRFSRNSGGAETDPSVQGRGMRNRR